MVDVEEFSISTSEAGQTGEFKKHRGRPKGSHRPKLADLMKDWNTEIIDLGVQADINPALLLFRQIDRVGMALSSSLYDSFINSVDQLYGLLSPNFDEKFKEQDAKIIAEHEAELTKLSNLALSTDVTARINQLAVNTAKKRFWALMELINRLGIWFERNVALKF